MHLEPPQVCCEVLATLEALRGVEYQENPSQSSIEAEYLEEGLLSSGLLRVAFVEYENLTYHQDFRSLIHICPSRQRHPGLLHCG